MGITISQTARFLATVALAAAVVAAETYYPPSEGASGWRRCRSDEEVRNNAGMDPQRLESVGRELSQIYKGPWQIVIIHRGYLVREWFGVPAMPATTFDVWSATKSATGIAYGLLLDDSRNHRLPKNTQIDLDSPAYDFVPEGRPLSDPRKEKIKLRHLLTMTSGIPGQSQGLLGIAVAPGGGEYELALGNQDSRYGFSAAKLFAEPGKAWEYSDAAFAHLSLIFARAAGREIADYMKERVFDPVGIRNVGWDWQGGAGNIGPHTNAHSGLRLSARDFARLGYLMAHQGVWQGRQIVPKWWIELATQSSQSLNPDYGYTFWVNTTVAGPGCPRMRSPSADSPPIGATLFRRWIWWSLDWVMIRRRGPSQPFWRRL